jgi:hypothetical protein
VARPSRGPTRPATCRARPRADPEQGVGQLVRVGGLGLLAKCRWRSPTAWGDLASGRQVAGLPRISARLPKLAGMGC